MNGFRLHRLAITASTNDDVRCAAEAGEAEGYAVQALQQTLGRGRHGRQWQSPAGNIYCSALLRPATSAQHLGHYSFVAALALADTVGHFLPQAPICLKWPNDVLLEDKKVSGILLETVDNGLIVGMGLNVAQHPEDSLYPSTSLVGQGLRKPDLDPIVNDLLDRLWFWYQTLQKAGFAPVRQAWLTKARKGPVSVRLPQETVQGEFVDLDADGGLRLRLANGNERSIASGDVFYRNDAVAQD